MQQKQELWKMSLSATRRSIGYTVFWQAAQLSFTWARRLKDCPGERVSWGPDACPSPSPPTPGSQGPTLERWTVLLPPLPLASYGRGPVRARSAEGCPRSLLGSPAQIPGAWGRGKGWQANPPPLTPSPPGQTPAAAGVSHPADHLHERGWPGQLLQPGTWLGGGDGGPR